MFAQKFFYVFRCKRKQCLEHEVNRSRGAFDVEKYYADCGEFKRQRQSQLTASTANFKRSPRAPQRTTGRNKQGRSGDPCRFPCNAESSRTCPEKVGSRESAFPGKGRTNAKCRAERAKDHPLRR